MDTRGRAPAAGACRVLLHVVVSTIVLLGLSLHGLSLHVTGHKDVTVHIQALRGVAWQVERRNREVLIR